MITDQAANPNKTQKRKKHQSHIPAHSNSWNSHQLHFQAIRTQSKKNPDTQDKEKTKN